MSHPAITVIVPFYNSANTLHKCIDSILSQTFADFELILVNDGSTDCGFSIAEKYASIDPRVQIISTEHLGVGNARNQALKKGSGDWLVFVDADDYVEPDFLQQLYDNSHSVDLVICGYFMDNVNECGEMISTTNFTPSSKAISKPSPTFVTDVEEYLSLGFLHINCIKLFKFDIIRNKKITFDNFPVNEDFIFALEYLKHVNQINFISLPLYHWMRYEGVASGVQALPQNIVKIYEESHKLLRDVLNDQPVADRVSYLSYEMVMYKVFKFRQKRVIDKKYFNNILHDFSTSPLIKQAAKAYNATTKFEKFRLQLVELSLFKVNYQLYRLLSLI